MTEDTTHVRVYESDKQRLRATRGRGSMAERFSHIIDSLWQQGPHYPVLKEREDKPLGPYVRCRDCGRSENTVEELNERACKDGIAIDE